MIGISTSIIRTARSDSLEDEGDEGRDELNETEKRIARIMLNESPPLGAMGKRGSSFEAAALGLRMPSFELDDQETVAEEPAPFSSGAACCPAGDVVAQVDKPAEKYRLEQGAFTKEAVPSSVPVTSSLSLMVVGLLRKSSLREEPGGLGGMVPIKPVGKGVPIKPAKKGASGPGSMKVAIEAAKAAEKKFKLHIFFEVDAPPVQLVIQGKCSVAEAISRALFKYKEEEREPQLASYSSENYEFRMLEDDEDDGTPDLDMPPLDRNKHVADCGIASVALCPVAGFDVSAAFENQKKQQQHARSISLQINTKRAAEAAANGLAGLEMLQPLFVRVHVLLGPKDKQTYTVSLRRQQRLIELLPLIQKKIHASNSNLVILDFASLPPVPTFGCIFFAQDVKLEPKFFKFVDMNDQELDYQMTLEETKTDEVILSFVCILKWPLTFLFPAAASIDQQVSEFRTSGGISSDGFSCRYGKPRQDA